MRIFESRNVAEALIRGLYHLHIDGISQESRNGPVVRSPGTVVTVLARPEERVLFYPWRDANPFFHFYESLWMLAGRNDIAPLTRYVARMAEYSDNGVTQNAAYGHRWRHATTISPHYGGPIVGERDQLDAIIKELRENKRSRQCVLQIWDHDRDLGTQTKDHACNLAVTFQIDVHDRLEAVIFCRSNDAIWGCHGANAVHFSVLQEYVARSISAPIGKMIQVSVNYHAYEQVFNKTHDAMRLAEGDNTVEPYRRGDVAPYPLMSVPREDWDNDVKNFITDDGRTPEIDARGFNDHFFQKVAWPIVQAHDIYKDHTGPDRFTAAIWILQNCVATDWRRACIEWLERRRSK